MNWDQVLPLRTPRPVDVGFLIFDPENPRYTPEKRPTDASDDATITWLDRTADLGELVQAIAHNGYIGIEPMIVFADGDLLVVLEGNRRLAALKVLRDPDLAARCRIGLPEIDPAVHTSFDQVLVYRVEDRNGAKELIGFKHINGPRGWDAYAKALYALRWLDEERGKPNGLTLRQIAERMGDKHDTLGRMVTAAYVIRQAQEEGRYDIEERKKKHFSFSHLYTALAYPEYAGYLGMVRPVHDQDPQPAPVPADKQPQLRQLLLWLYGSKREGVEPVIESQAKDLNRLKRVLGSPAATRELAERGDLDAAVVTATPRADRFASSLIGASAELALALELMTDYDPTSQPDLEEHGRLCLQRAEIIEGAMTARQRRAAAAVTAVVEAGE